MQKIKVWPFYQIVNAQIRIPENEMQKILKDFNIQMDHLIPARKLDLALIKEKKELASL